MSPHNKSQLRILILTHNYIRYPGDHAGHFLHVLAQGLVRDGHKVFVLAPHQKGLSKLETIDGVAIHRFVYAPANLERLAYIGTMHQLVAQSWVNKFLFISFLFSFLFKALRLSLKEKVDLISTQWWIPAGVVGYAASLLMSKPYVSTSHGTDIRILEKGGLLSKAAGLVFRRARCVTTVSGFLKQRLLDRIDLNPEKVRVIPMPVTPHIFNPTPLKAEGTKLILCVARYTNQKGLDHLLRACRILKDQGIDFRTKIVGEGPLEGFLQEEIIRLELEKHVSLVHTVPPEKLNLLYAESYLCVLSSIEEGFGLVLVEAQLCKRPVVGTRSGGITDIIQDNQTGLLVPPGDHLKLAEALEKILTDEKLASHLAEEGYRRARVKFSPEHIAREFAEIFEPFIKV